jgi:small-conductance mechanosensitive channel
MDVVVTYDTDIDALEKLIDRLGRQMSTDKNWKEKITEPIAFSRVERYEDKGVVVRIIGKVAPASQWEVNGEFRRRLLKSVLKSKNVALAGQ